MIQLKLASQTKMKKQQLKKILQKPYIRLPLDESEPWPKTRYVKRPRYLPEIDCSKVKSEEEVGALLLTKYSVKETKIVGKMKVNIRAFWSQTDADFIAIKGDIVELSWWKDGAEVSFEDLYALKNDEDDLEDYPIELVAHGFRTGEDWEYDESATDDLEVCRALIL